MNYCPVCNSGGEPVRTLQKEYIKNQLEAFFNDTVPEEISFHDYEIIRCTNCTLEYAMPLLPGDDKFYRWIGSHFRYYPEERWEWLPVLDRLREMNNDTLDVLEIGCGTGNFMEKVVKIPNIKAYGVDISTTAIEECERKGLTVHQGTIDSLLTEQSSMENRFDLIAAFHCLEHVEDPKNYVNNMIHLLKNTGTIFLSTPYSPTSWEYSCFAPLNNPPHHLTRWNKKSFEKLAQQLSLDISIMMPQAMSAFYRTATVINLLLYGHFKQKSKWQTFIDFFKKPIFSIIELIRQLQREKINGKVAADIVLVELSRK